MPDNIEIAVAGGTGRATLSTHDDGTAHRPKNRLSYIDGTVLRDVAVATPFPVQILSQLGVAAPPVAAQLEPKTSGGLLVDRFIAAGSTNLRTQKASAGQLYGVVASNLNAAARYLKFYNKASNPAPATDVPFLVIPIQGSATAGQAPPVAMMFENGIAFSVGIACALVAGIGDTDNTSVTVNEHAVNILYK